MTAGAGTSARGARRRPAARSGRSRASGRRRATALGAAVAIVVVAALALKGVGPLQDTVREITLPLRHEDVIRQQAAAKGLDPALIAAVIYEESRFADRTSPVGAKGLMQILPGTARFIARKSGGTEFELRDLGTPQINIAYGSWYLRYLDRRYDGNTTLAVAAHNAGERHVDAWVRAAGGPDRFRPDRDIPFPETREYVKGVIEHREEYRRHYAEELGL